MDWRIIVGLIGVVFGVGNHVMQLIKLYWREEVVDGVVIKRPLFKSFLFQFKLIGLSIEKRILKILGKPIPKNIELARRWMKPVHITVIGKAMVATSGLLLFINAIPRMITDPAQSIQTTSVFLANLIILITLLKRGERW